MTLRQFAGRITPALAFLLVFGAAPLAVLFAYSFGSSTFFEIELGTSLENYRVALTNDLYVRLLGRSILIGGIAAGLTVVIAYPFVYSITLGRLSRWGDVLLLLVVISLFSAYIVRVYAWRTVLGRNGVVNTALESVGLIDEPLTFLLFSRFAVVVTLVNVLLPLAVLPLYASLSGIDRQLLEASRTLGASPMGAFRRVILPLSARGVQAAFALCFIVAAGDYVTPQLVGSANSQLIGNVIVQWFGISFNWPLGAALAFLLMAATAVTLIAFVTVSRWFGLRDRPA